MGKLEIRDKLIRELDRDICDEPQVIYILTRIRKYLEIQGKQGDFKYLNFYCNWALHTKIDRTEKIEDILHNFINGEDDGRFLSFDPLVVELKKFLVEYDLPIRILDDTDNFLRFINLLVDIYSDTPVIVEMPRELRTITITKPGFAKEYPFTINYTIK